MSNGTYLRVIRLSLMSVLLLSLLSTLGYAQPSTTVDLDSNGDADMVVIEEIDMDLDEVDFVLSGSADAPMTFSGTLSSLEAYATPDYTLKITSDSTESEVDFDMWGEDILFILGIYGEFDLNISLIESSDKVTLVIEGEASRDLFDLLPSVDINYLISDEFDITEVEEDINYLFSQFPLPTKPKITLETFNVSGLFMPDISITATIDNWDEVSTFLLPHSYEEVPESEQFLHCLGLSPDDVVSLFLGSNRAVTISLVGFDGKISADIQASTTLSDQAISGAKISSLDVDITADSTTTELSGSLFFDEPRTVLSCMLKQNIPGEYTLDSFDYSITKSSSTPATHSFEADLKNFAEKSGDERQVSFPSELTSEGSIEVTIPSGMEILSVEGGSKENSKTAVSTPGEDFTVTYGPEAGGIDNNLIIIAVVVILLLLLLAKRKK